MVTAAHYETDLDAALVRHIEHLTSMLDQHRAAIASDAQAITMAMARGKGYAEAMTARIERFGQLVERAEAVAARLAEQPQQPLAATQPAQATQPAKPKPAPAPAPARRASANGRQAYCDCECGCWRQYETRKSLTCCACPNSKYQGQPCGCQGREGERLTKTSGKWRWMPGTMPLAPQPQAESVDAYL